MPRRSTSQVACAAMLIVIIQLSFLSQSPPSFTPCSKDELLDAKMRITVKVGKEDIIIPLPIGYINPRATDKEFLKMTNKINVKTMDMLALLVPKEDYHAFRQLKIDSLPCYITITTLKSQESAYISIDSFRAAKPGYRTMPTPNWLEIKNSLDRAIKLPGGRESKEVVLALEASLEDIAGMGVTYETEQALSYGFLIKFKSAIAGVTEHTLVACITTLLLARGKCLIVTNYVHVDALKDIERAKLISREMTDKIQTLNR